MSAGECLLNLCLFILFLSWRACLVLFNVLGKLENCFITWFLKTKTHFGESAPLRVWTAACLVYMLWAVSARPHFVCRQFYILGTWGHIDKTVFLIFVIYNHYVIHIFSQLSTKGIFFLCLWLPSCQIITAISSRTSCCWRKQEISFDVLNEVEWLHYDLRLHPILAKRKRKKITGANMG